MYIQGASNSYDQNGHIIGVTGILEPAESTDVVPTINPGTEVSTGEGRGCKTRAIRAVSVEVGSPVEQSLDNCGLSAAIFTIIVLTYKGATLVRGESGINYSEVTGTFGVSEV